MLVSADSNLTIRNWFHSLPSQRFHALLTLFPKSCSPFPHGTCLLSVSDRYLALEENYLPFSAALPNYATLWTHTVRAELPTYTGFSPSLMLSSNKTYAGVHTGDASLDHNSRPESRDLRFELFPVQSPLLRESYSFSFPPLTYMLKFSG